MLIDGAMYGGKCACGREHAMETRAAVIERGALDQFEEYMSAYGPAGRRCALYGGNSYEAAAGKRPKAEQEIILNPKGLHADEKATAAVLSRMEPQTEILIAVGGGTIHDIARFCACERGIAFVSVPTAASVDGFCSKVAAMTWRGFKKTIPAAAPALVVADTDIIKKAPARLVKSGIGDILAKYTALADWKISSLLTGEALCPKIYDMVKAAADAAVAGVPGIIAGEGGAYENVMYALLLSGLAMQLHGSSRPASGAEHHISHLIEEEPAMLKAAFPAMHGEKAGVGAVLAAAEYHRLAEAQDISALTGEYSPLPSEEIRRFFGGELAEAILRENSADCLRAVSRRRLIECWPEIRSMVAEIPPAEELSRILEGLCAKRGPEDIGIAASRLPDLLDYSPFVRNRLTLMRLRRMIKV